MGLSTEYRGYTISYDEERNEWFAYQTGRAHDREFPRSSLEEVKKAIGDSNRRQFKCYKVLVAPRFKVLLAPRFSWPAFLNEAVVTSVNVDGDVRITRTTGKGEIRHERLWKGECMYTDTPENGKRYDEIKKLRKQVEEIETKIDLLFASMEKVDDPATYGQEE